MAAKGAGASRGRCERAGPSGPVWGWGERGRPGWSTVWCLRANTHPISGRSRPRSRFGEHLPDLSTPKPPHPPPRDLPQGRLVSPWGARAKNGRVNWGKLTRRKTPQHLEKQEQRPGEGGQSLGSQNPSGAIIHPSVRGLPPAPHPRRSASGFKGPQTAHCAGPGSLAKSSSLQLLVT